MIECTNTDYMGNKWWLENGKLHREDGPAVEFFSGEKAWWINGKEYTREEFILYQFSKRIITNE